MATFSQSTIEKGSDTIQDFCCKTCEDMKLEESADFYCETCMKFYCRKCINPHDQLFKKHSPYGREDVKKWPVSKKVEDFLQKCVVHKDKNLEMFCQDHSQLCCNNCAFIDHRLCKTVTLISDYVKYNAIDLQQQSDCIQKILEEMKKLLDNKDASFRSVQSSYEEQVQKIHETRRKINEALDQIEKKTLNEMKDALTKLQSSLKSDVDKCATLRDELKRLRDAIQDICDKSNLDLSFIASRKCHDKIPQVEAYLKGNSVHVQVSITFEPNNEIEEYLSKLSGFGRIENRTQTLTMQGNPDQSQGEQRPPLPPLSKRDTLNRPIAGAVGRERVLPPIPDESSRRFAAGDLKGNGNIGATGGVDSQRVALKGLAVDTEDLEGIYSSVPKTLNDFELRRDQIDVQDLLGSFGSVCKGTFTLRNGKTITVAVKTFKHEDVTPRQENEEHDLDENDLLEEAKIMMKLSHKHILRMFGTCTAENLMLVLEYGPLGRLNSFLSAHRNFPQAGIVLLLWQVAMGMEFLESKKIIHRDVSARNVLLFTESFAKICDFGFSKELPPDDDYYEAQEAGKWPMKWLAPECVYYWKYDSKSDVWAYGVTMWEAMSYGEKPYQGKRVLEILKFLVEEEKRMEKPPLCDEDVYDVMLSCWEYEKEHRPTFAKIVTWMGDIYKLMLNREART